MNGSEVNFLMSPEGRAALDDNKTMDQLAMKATVFDIAFHQLEAANTPAEAISGDSYAFVPFPCGAFVDMAFEAFLVLGQDKSKKFLDIGAGMGTKVILASVLFDAYGIELDPANVEKAKAIGLNRIGVADALAFDRYNEFDVLYYYRPISDAVLYRQFEEKVHADMKAGALVAPMHSEYDWDGQADMKKIGRFLYVKK